MNYQRQTRSRQDKEKEAQQKTKRGRKPKAAPKKSYTYKPQEARGLSDKQMRFCDEYIVDLNATKAAERAGYVKSNAANIGWQLTNENIDAKRYIAHLKVERAKRLEVSQDRIIQELARIAYHDHRTFYDKNGWPLPINLITDDQQTAIKDIAWAVHSILDKDNNKVLDKNAQPIEERHVTKYTFYNRVDALKMLGCHIGMSLDKPAEKTSGNEKNTQEITFETLLRRLKAVELEQLTQWLVKAAQPIPSMPTQDESNQSDHWADKAIDID